MRSTFIPPARHEFDTLFLESPVRGGGLEDIRIFLPPPVQRGRRGGGIFNVLSGLAKKAIPFLMRNVAPEAMRMGKDVLGDVLDGRDIRHSLKTRGVAALKGVGRRLVRGGGGRVRKPKKRHTRGGRKKTNKRKMKRHARKTCYKSDIFNMKTLV